MGLNDNNYPSFVFSDDSVNYSYGSLNAGDTAWMLTSTALVLLMSMPGLAIYYSGMLRDKNVLHCKFNFKLDPIIKSVHLMTCETNYNLVRYIRHHADLHYLLPDHVPLVGLRLFTVVCTSPD